MKGGHIKKNFLTLFFFVCVCFFGVVVFLRQAADGGGRELSGGGGRQLAGPTYIDSPMESSSSRDKGK